MAFKSIMGEKPLKRPRNSAVPDNVSPANARLIQLLLLALCLGALAWFVRDDIADYRAFKLLTDTKDRQQRYLVWVLRAFLLFCGATIVSLES